MLAYHCDWNLVRKRKFILKLSAICFLNMGANERRDIIGCNSKLLIQFKELTSQLFQLSENMIDIFSVHCFFDTKIYLNILSFLTGLVALWKLLRTGSVRTGNVITGNVTASLRKARVLKQDGYTTREMVKLGKHHSK